MLIYEGTAFLAEEKQMQGPGGWRKLCMLKEQQRPGRLKQSEVGVGGVGGEIREVTEMHIL